MKTARFLFWIMIEAVLLTGTALARTSSSAPQPASAQNEKSGSDQQKDADVHPDKDQSRSGEAIDEAIVGQKRPAANVTRTANQRPSASRTKPPTSHQPHSTKTLATNSRTNPPGSILAPQPTKAAAAKAVNQRSVPALPPTASLNGQQFKNSRDPGSRLAVSGGPLTAARGAAALNGSNMKRKP